jgi:hypothetical protein
VGNVQTDFGEQFSVMGEGWNWFKIVSMDGLCY